MPFDDHRTQRRVPSFIRIGSNYILTVGLQARANVVFTLFKRAPSINDNY